MHTLWSSILTLGEQVHFILEFSYLMGYISETTIDFQVVRFKKIVRKSTGILISVFWKYQIQLLVLKIYIIPHMYTYTIFKCTNQIYYWNFLLANFNQVLVIYNTIWLQF